MNSIKSTMPIKDATSESFDSEDTSITFKGEGIEWILLPTSDLNLDLEFYERTLKLKPLRTGKAKNDPFLDEYAILKTPNGVVLEIVKPKLEHMDLFKYPIFCYTVENLYEKYELMRVQNERLISDIVDTHEAWGWFYVMSRSGTLFQLQGPLPKKNLSHS